MKSVRSAARALIVQKGQLLTIQMRHEDGQPFYILPGGGQMHGETLEQSLKRECLEEIGRVPMIGPIAYVREYIGRNHSFEAIHKDWHQLEVVFHCHFESSHQAMAGFKPDKNQSGICWIPLEDLQDLAFYPMALKPFVRDGEVRLDLDYLGDVC